MMNGCGKCSKVGAVLFLVFGVLFLLQDLSVWSFWNISWWTVVFVLMGVTGLAMSSCSECCSIKNETVKPKKK